MSIISVLKRTDPETLPKECYEGLFVSIFHDEKTFNVPVFDLIKQAVREVLEEERGVKWSDIEIDDKDYLYQPFVMPLPESIEEAKKKMDYLEGNLDFIDALVAGGLSPVSALMQYQRLIDQLEVMINDPDWFN